MLINESVHASGVCVGERAVAIIQALGGIFGHMPQLQRPVRYVRLERAFAEDFCKFTGSVATGEIHLPEAILRGDVTLRKEEVMQRGSRDVGNALRVTYHVDGSAEAGDFDRAVELRERCIGCMAEPKHSAGDDNDN